MIDDTDTHPPGDDDPDATQDHGAPADASADGHPDDAQATAGDDEDPPLEEQIEAAHPSTASFIPDDYDPRKSPILDNPVRTTAKPKRGWWDGPAGHKRRLAFALKAQKALEYRIAGYNFAEIAQFLGYAGKQGAEYAVKQALKARSQELADEALSLDLERLDRYLRAAHAPAVQGDLTAIASAQSLITQRQRLLGLDKPTKVAVTDTEGKDLPLPAAVAWTGTLGMATGLVAQLLAAGTKNVVPDEPDVPEEKPA